MVTDNICIAELCQKIRCSFEGLHLDIGRTNRGRIVRVGPGASRQTLRRRQFCRAPVEV